MSTAAPRSWRMYAQRQKRVVEGREFMHFGSEVHVRRGYGGDVVQVELTEDPGGPYYGWVPNGDRTGPDGIPTMIQPHHAMFAMQFPYGPDAEQEWGRGEIVRLSVKGVAPSA